MNAPLEHLTPIVERIAWALLHSIWQGGVVALLLVAVLAVTKRSSAALRHVLCLASLIVTLIFALATLCVVQPSRPAAALPGGLERASATRGSAMAVSDVNLNEQPSNSSDQSGLANAKPAARVPQSLSERIAPWLRWIAVAWVSGVALLSLRHFGAWRQIRRMRSLGEAPGVDLQRAFDRLVKRFELSAARLIESSSAAAPMLTGVVKPIVILPASLMTGLSTVQIEAILAHELAHLARHDTWSNLMQVIIETIFFYHPAVWWMSYRTRIEREHAADDLAISVTSDAHVYAAALTRLAELQAGPSLVLAATGGQLLHRIRRIVAPASLDRTPGTAGVGLPVLIATLTLCTLLASRGQQTESSVKTTGNVQEQSKQWIADAFQLDDAAKRIAAIERVRTAMQSSSPEEAREGAKAFNRLGQIQFDKAVFRPVVRSLLSSSDAATRAAAASAFTATGADPEDLPRIYALADDPAPEVRDGLTYVIVQLNKYDLTGKPASDAILKLMDKLPKDARSVAHALWGSKFSPEIEARVLEYCRDMSGFGVGYNFFYGSLSTQANKSEASIKRLIEILADEDTTNKAGRAAWGLQQGVSPAQYGLVADAMIKVIEARSDGNLRNNALRCLRTYGSAAQGLAIKAILEKPGVTGEFRTGLEQVLAGIESKPASAPVASNNQNANPPSTSSSPATTTATQTSGEKASVEVEWKGKWWPATVLKKDGDRTQIHYVGYGSDWDEWVGPERIRALATAAASTTIEKPQPANPAEKNAALIEQNRQAARVRANKDRETYSIDQLREIETLYQVANTKGKRSPEARTSLTQLLEKYDKANRTGCATLYLGQASEGDERLKYLSTAVEKFSDCYYFNGCQVGGYGRYVLLLTLWDRGEKDKARVLLDELKTTYKDATGHSGERMGDMAIAVEKELENQVAPK